MLVIGLTGGIGSGKTTVANYFEKLGVPIIDADIIAHELVSPGSDASLEIANTFGSEFFDDKGELDRSALSDVVFNDSNKLSQLENILHPRIRQALQDEVDKLDSCYCILAIPLLVETGGNPLVQRTLVVDCPEELQVARVMKRNPLSEEQVRAIMSTQASREQRLGAADDLLDNSSGLEKLEYEVQQLHRQYLDLCKQA